MLACLIDKLKDNGIMPWEIEMIDKNETLIEDGYITENEYNLLKNCKYLSETFENCDHLHELLRFAYIDFDSSVDKLEIPESVKDAYKVAQKDYKPASICTDLLYGVSGYWYNEVLNDYIKRFDKPEQGVLLLYLHGND